MIQLLVVIGAKIEQGSSSNELHLVVGCALHTPFSLAVIAWQPKV